MVGGSAQHLTPAYWAGMDRLFEERRGAAGTASLSPNQAAPEAASKAESSEHSLTSR